MLNKYMTSCDWWNIKWNTKNSIEDLYSFLSGWESWDLETYR